MLVGAHVSVAGGLWRAPGRGREIGANAIQIFTRNQVQWRALPVGRREAEAFKAAVAENELRMVVAHGSYLINLASPEPATLQRSRGALLAELRRCAALGVRLLVLHPGAHMGAGESLGIRRIVASIDHVLARAEGLDVTLLLEVTAGQGSSLGHRFEHLAEILDGVRSPERLGVCLDTCHLLAAGYDIARAKGYEQTVRELDRLVSLQKVRAVHLNDARAGLGSPRPTLRGPSHASRDTRTLRSLAQRDRPVEAGRGSEVDHTNQADLVGEAPAYPEPPKALGVVALDQRSRLVRPLRARPVDRRGHPQLPGPGDDPREVSRVEEVVGGYGAFDVDEAAQVGL